MATQRVWDRIAFLQGDSTLAGFCRQVGLNYQAMKKSSQRKTAPDTLSLEKIARHSRCDLNWLISGKCDNNKLSSRISKKIRTLRKQQGWSLQNVADQLSMHTSVYEKYEKGAWPLSMNLINDFTRLFKIDAPTFFQEESHVSQIPVLKIYQASNIKGSPKIRNEDYISIPLTRSSIAAGQPIIQENQIDDYVLLHIRAAGNKNNLVASRVDGDSMEPMLHSKDIVVIDRNDKKIVSNKIYAVFYEEGLTAKFVEKQKDLLILRPINPTSQVQVVNLNENQDPVVGRIIGAWKEL